MTIREYQVQWFGEVSKEWHTLCVFRSIEDACDEVPKIQRDLFPVRGFVRIVMVLRTTAVIWPDATPTSFPP